MKKITIILFLGLISCNKELPKDLSFKIKNPILDEKNVLDIEICNTSEKNYFVIIDTLRTYDYDILNYKINDHIHIIPKFYLENDSVNSSLQTVTYKLSRLDTVRNNCIKKERTLMQGFLKQVSQLENAIIIEKHSSVNLKIPFATQFSSCNRPYNYLLHKNLKYLVQFKYKMSQEFINNNISKAMLSEFKTKQIEPYLDEITSNNIPVIVK